MRVRESDSQLSFSVAKGPVESRPPELRIFDDEMIVDLFAGGGGWSLGIEQALGRSPDAAVNHDSDAVAMHEANHPKTKHYIEDIYDVSPTMVCHGRRCGLLVMSPDCTEHSRAKNGSIVRDRKVRSLADVVHRWIAEVYPRVILLENVAEWLLWGPLDEDGRIDKTRQGEFFEAWKRRLENAGYRVSVRILCAADFGAPTSRKRVFVIARRDGIDPELCWPEPTHGPSRPLPYRTAAECIDYSEPCPSIFMSKRQAKKYLKETGIKCKRPLKPTTMRRIRRGIWKYVLRCARPFIVPVSHGIKSDGEARCHSVDDPTRTITGANRGELALVQPIVTPVKTWGGGGNEAAPADKPHRTITTSKRGEFAIVQPMVTRYNGQSVGQAVTDPLTTVDTNDRFGLVAPTLVRYNGDVPGAERAQDITNPLSTADTSNRFALVAPTLIQTGYGERPGQKPRCLDLQTPLGTIMSGGDGGVGKHAVVAAFISKGFSEQQGGFNGASSLGDPLGTVTQRDHNNLCVSHLMRLRGTSDAHVNSSSLPADMPVPTISAGGCHIAEVRAFLSKACEDAVDDPELRAGILTIGESKYQITDIGMRMFKARELFRASGFPDSYIINPVTTRTIRWTRKGKTYERKVTGPLTETIQIEKCGNAVPPPLACAVVRSVFAITYAERQVAA